MKTLLFALLLLSTVAHAQLPSYLLTPEQRIATLTARLKTADSVLIETRNNSKVAIEERDKRIQALETDCNAQVSYYYQRSSELATQNETLTANLDERNSQLDTANAALHKLQPRTWVGRQLRAARNGLAVVGGLAIVGLVIVAR